MRLFSFVPPFFFLGGRPLANYFKAALENISGQAFEGYFTPAIDFSTQL